MMLECEREERYPGRHALRHLERVLEQRPHKDDHELSHLTRCLAGFRSELIRRQEPGAATARLRECLGHLNAIVSVAMGMHFPLGTPPWDEFAKTRGWLEELVAEIEP